MAVKGLSTVVWLISSLNNNIFWMLCSKVYNDLYHLPLILHTDSLLYKVCKTSTEKFKNTGN